MEAISLLVPVVEYTIKPVVRQVGYLINYKSNVQNLETQIEELVLAKETLQHRLDQELRRGRQKIKADVQKWLIEMDEIIANAKQFLEGERQAKKCLNGFCRYHPNRKATKLAQIMVIGKGKEFPSVSYSTPPKDIWTTVDFLAFESRTSIVTQILEEFKKDNIFKIGVYGMGGVGKTTLVKQVASQAEDEKLYNNVAKVGVKQNTDAKRIQNEIAEKLGLKRFNENETEAGRARFLSDYIKDKEILVIFWEELDLEKLGVPVGMCKLLFTSRTKEVLSSKIGTQQDFMLKVLNEEETWNLFENTVSEDAVKDPDIGKVAIEVANQCKGLPILVVTVAKALKGKKLHSWKDVLRNLKLCGGDELEKAYSGIEWSYNQLVGAQLKSLFLIFGMSGGRYYHLNYMLKCTLGLSLFEGINTMEEANDRLHSLVDKLKDYCLLLDTNEDGFVTMHDLTRDVARKIASMEGHFLSKGYGDEFKEWPTKEVLEKCTMISLDEINIPNEELGSPELQMFELHSKDKTLEIPPHFFMEMKQLKVLDLTNLCIPSLSPSVQSLSSLQTLCLDQWELRDLGIVGELRSLEILSLMFSKFKQLPKEIGLLTRLRLLDLRSCPELEVIHPNVISSLTRLEELNMNNSFNKWETEEANNNISLGSNASLSELKHLSNLTTLGINIKAAVQLPFNFFNFFYDKLNHFKIFIGDVWDWDAEYSTSKTLKLKLSQTNQWDQEVEDCKRMKEIVEGKEEQLVDDPIKFLGLRSLTLQSLPELISFSSNHSPLVASTSRNPMQLFNDKIVFPKLKDLILSSIPLNELWDGQLSTRLCWIQNLTSLTVEGCDGLTFLCSSFMSMNLFVQLKRLRVRRCQNIVEIISTEEYGEVKNISYMFPKLETLVLEALGKLETICSSASYIEFSCLESLIIKKCSKLGPFIIDPRMRQNIVDTAGHHLFDEKVGFPRLEYLVIEGLHKLTTVWHIQRAPDSFCKLTKIQVISCSSLLHILVPGILKSLHSLKELYVEDCESVEVVFKVEGTSEIFTNEELLDGEEPHVFAHLKSLKIHGMDNLIHVWKDNSNLPGPVFPNLEILKVKKCDRLKNIVPSDTSFCNLVQLEVVECHGLEHLITCSVAKSFHQLKSIIVENCQKTLEIVASSDDNENIDEADANEIIFSRLKDLKLCNLPNLKGFCSRNYNVKFPFLTTWSATNCIEMKISIDGVLQNDSKHGVVPR
ncbi:hypothetical protein FNV43_RR08841 [Rhamnella rubrinervis]|uniref:NB-ARC domain-containing protein n=1 Tax=Rhamnella rubrinervis TaxID=2594499 RepID=A0A8K0MJR2_9ROSA|nr:hypothetical protein FNV43_RR08841 [Rhamnella rubrinervis]